MHSLVAATKDTIRVWDLGITSTRLHSSSSKQHSYRNQVNSGSNASISIATDAIYTADKCAGLVQRIATVSWAADGHTFVAGGRGRVIRQYSRTGEHQQDIGLKHHAEGADTADITAARHFGSKSESLFVANNATKQVRRWDFIRKEFAVCQTHENDISCLAVSTKRGLVASATAHGGEIALFNLLHNTRTDLRSATHRALTCIDIASAHKSQVSVGSEDGLLQLFDTTRSGGTPVRSFSHLHSAPLRGLAFHPLAPSTLVTAGLDKRVVITDAGVYSSRNAIEIVSSSPLSCLSCTQDPFVVGVGTIDGDVLVYDVRMAAKPQWSATVSPNHAVVSMDIVHTHEHKSNSISQPLSRSASQREARPNSRTAARINGYNSSDDATATSLRSEHGRLRGTILQAENARLRDEKHVPPIAPTLTTSKLDIGRRPPQHPSISRFRAAVNEHRLSSNVISKELPAADLNHRRNGHLPSNEAVDVEEMSFMVKDRSYMDLLSPAKPDKPLAVNTSLVPVKQPDLLTMLSGNGPVQAGNDTHSKISDIQKRDYELQKPRALLSSATSQNPADLEAEPSSLPWPQHHYSNRAEKHQRYAHDAGDSIMEVFTPEREPRSRPTSSGLNMQSNPSPTGIAKSLVSQLLEKQSTCESGALTAGTASAGSGQKSRQPESTALSKEAEPTKRARLENKPPPMPVVTSAPVISSAPVATATPADAAGKPRVDPAISQPAVASTAGLGPAVSSSVLQNAISDALAPLSEQIRGEIRNLHLDIIRQGFMYQEQIRALRQECSEARVLRQEIDRLRRENEQLRRYVPFFEPPGGGASKDS
ncbi:hypothetical protein LPJ68_004655 [Coemansia sp. RSA 1086]|nr:hypothetical protein LPJ68_004655 [Coemansia sp. RSA 1086]